MEAIQFKYDPTEEAMSFLRLLYGRSLTEKAKTREDRSEDHCREDKDFAWTFVGTTAGPHSKVIEKHIGVRTYETLKTYVEDQNGIFITPNQFISRRERSEVMLEIINAVVVDVDDTQDVNEALGRMKFPGRATPTLVNKTTKGLHFWYVFDKPVKATKGNRERYKKIAKAMTITSRADESCTSPSHYFRIPRKIEIYQPWARVSFLKMYYWAKKKLKADRETQVYGSAKPDQLIKSKAFEEILKGVSSGIRNDASYMLSVIYRSDGSSKNDTFEKLVEWNQRNEPPLSVNELKRTLNSVYKRPEDTRLPLNMLKNFSGLEVNYGCYGRIITPPKPREERERVHYDERLQDLVDFMKLQPEGLWIGSQKQLSEVTNIPLRSLKDVIQKIKNGTTDEIQMRTEGLGCKAKTILQYFVPQTDFEKGVIIDFVPQSELESPCNRDFVPQIHRLVPQQESIKGEIIKFVPQSELGTCKTFKFVPQNESKKGKVIKFVPQGIIKIKIEKPKTIETREFGTGRSGIHMVLSGGHSKHPRRGYLLKRGCGMQDPKGTQSTTLPLEGSSSRKPVGPLGLVGCRPEGAQSTNQVVHRPRGISEPKQSTTHGRNV